MFVSLLVAVIGTVLSQQTKSSCSSSRVGELTNSFVPLRLFQEVMQDYRDEIKDFFAVDKQLASELEYDMKKYQEQLAQEQELARQADANRAEGADGAQAVQVGEQHGG